jgi:hypothetical protein
LIISWYQGRRGCNLYDLDNILISRFAQIFFVIS